MHDLLIIGGGPGGISAALWAKRLGCTPLLLEANAQLGGQLLRTYNRLIDCPGFWGLTGIEIAERLEEHVRSLDVPWRVNTPVTRINASTHSVWTAEEQFQARALILALGVVKRRLGIPGEREFAGRGVSTSATRDAALYTGQPVAIVGGGDGAFEEALMLANEGCQVTLIHRSDQFRARAMYLKPVLTDPRITMKPFTRLTRILGDDRVTGLELEVARPDEPVMIEYLPVNGVFLTLGTEPATRLVVGQLDLDSEGFIVTDRWGATSVPGVWAVGDTCHPLLPSLSTAFGQGATAAKAAYNWLQTS
ncbi:MAG: FAD-dependent oxidoreductase [Acidobacteria bacterium]|nr:FAD-dependent oxidoreductase [Acidobacteriota bacterium]